MTLFHRLIAVAWLWLAPICASAAEPLVSINNGALPPIPDTISHLLAIDGRTVGVGSDALWLLDKAQTTWTRAERARDGEVIAVAGNAGQGVLLLGPTAGGPVERIATLLLEGNLPRLRVLPPLPSPLASAHAAVLGTAIFVAGTNDGTPALISIDPTTDSGWVTHAEWPGSVEAITSMVAQRGALYVTLEGQRMLRWSMSDGWAEQGVLPGHVVRGTARAIGQSHLLFAVRAAPDALVRLVMFHTITGSSAVLGDTSANDAHFGAAFATGIVFARPVANGAGTDLTTAQLESGRFLLSTLDWVMIVFYLVSMLGMGLYFYLKEKRNSTSDFFVGGRTIPYWAAGISLYAANTSSISYIAIPAKAFETNWQYLTNNLVAVLGLMFVAVWIVPLLRRLDLMSVFQYLETRFHPVIRTLASALYMAVQIGSSMSVIL
ncbi:MAG TPA: hypothetical protein VNA21_02185, partial [Steroidobacteraceae bacterium]|nr:hypothetical protein [Steroidobacteraceae bacterium]